MARILYGGGVTAIRGSIGGLTFQNNTSGNIVRARPHLSKASTKKQSATHVQLQTLQHAWQQITSDQQEAWNTYGTTWTKINKFGQVKTLTGSNWFVSVNFMRLAMSLSILADPPVHDIPPSPPEFGITFTPTELFFNYVSAFDFVNNALILSTTTPTRTASLSINRIRKQVVIWTADPGSPADITSLWEAATQMQFDPVNTFPNANIYFCLQSVTKASGITSAMYCLLPIPIESESESIFYYS